MARQVLRYSGYDGNFEAAETKLVPWEMSMRR